jgi:hypothetical protein
MSKFDWSFMKYIFLTVLVLTSFGCAHGQKSSSANPEANGNRALASDEDNGVMPTPDRIRGRVRLLSQFISTLTAEQAQIVVNDLVLIGNGNPKEQLSIKLDRVRSSPDIDFPRFEADFLNCYRRFYIQNTTSIEIRGRVRAISESLARLTPDQREDLSNFLGLKGTKSEDANTLLRNELERNATLSPEVDFPRFEADFNYRVSEMSQEVHGTPVEIRQRVRDLSMAIARLTPQQAHRVVSHLRLNGLPLDPIGRLRTELDRVILDPAGKFVRFERGFKNVTDTSGRTEN